MDLNNKRSARIEARAVKQQSNIKEIMDIEMTDDEILQAMDDDDYRIVPTTITDKQQQEL